MPPPLPPSFLPVASRALAHIDDFADRAGFRGWLIIAVFFGLLGTWLLLAPLNGAVVADGLVKVDGNRRPVQHLDGGIVRRLLVREGDAVRPGQPLVELDDSELAAGFQVLDETVLQLRASEVRLDAEQRGDAALALPPPLAQRGDEPRARAIWHDQLMLFSARRSEQQGEDRIAEKRLAQLARRIDGSKAQLVALEAQERSLRQELATLRPLMAKGIVTRQRLLELERTISSVAGQIGQATAAIAGGEQAVAEQGQVAMQSHRQRATAVAQELRDVRMKLAEVVPKLASAMTVRKRSIIAAPCAGRVVGLGAFPAGAVVGRGERLMEIVPDADELVVEARIGVADVADIEVGAAAEVRISGYSQKTTPALTAHVVDISADRFTDQRTGIPYYSALVRIDTGAGGGGPAPTLKAGMGASVTIPTIARTAMQYLTDPLRASFSKALRER